MTTDQQSEAAPDPGHASVVSDVPATATAAAKETKKRHRTGLGARLFSLALIFGVIFGIFALSGKPIPMPTWVVAEIEQRANKSLAKALPEAAIAIGGVEITVED